MAKSTRKLTKPRPGVYEGVPFSQYESWPYVNASSLGAAVRSAAHYSWQLEQPARQVTDELRFGSLVHAMLADDTAAYGVVDGDKWQELCSQYDHPTRTNAWARLVKKIQQMHPGAEVYTPVEWERATAVINAVHASRGASRYLEQPGKHEVSIVWDDPATKLRCKARLDFVVPGQWIVDLKTTRDASTFEQAIRQWHYHRQMAFYQAGWAIASKKGELLPTVLIAVESHPYHGVRSGPLNEDALARGREEYEVALGRIARARKSGEWPGYSDPEYWEVAGDDSVTLWVGGEEHSW